MKELRLRWARARAAELVASYGLERPEQLEDIAWLLGVQVVNGGLSGSLARVTRFDQTARIRVSEDHLEPGQVRFSIAHELGHFVLGHHGVAMCKAGDMHAHGADPLWEQEANVFAADLLLPAHLVRPRCEVSPVHLGLVDAIAAEFGTSLVATAIRFVELTSERCAAVLSQRGRVRWSVRSATFWPEIPRGKPVLPWTVAHDYFRGKPLADDCEEVDATAWIDGDYLRGPATIREHARVVPSIDAVLSLLWIPESCRTLAHRAL